jgi:hypothetical protein
VTRGRITIEGQRIEIHDHGTQSRTPDAGRSATGAFPRVLVRVLVVVDTILAKQFLSLLPHARIVDPRKPPVSLRQFFSIRSPPTRQRT